RHNVNLLGGYSYQDFENDWLSFNTYNFPTDLFGTNRLQSGDALAAGKAGVQSFKSSYKVIGFFGRLNYDWDNRFLLMGSLRYEANTPDPTGMLQKCSVTVTRNVFGRILAKVGRTP